jgi:hypothetical protein
MLDVQSDSCVPSVATTGRAENSTEQTSNVQFVTSPEFGIKTVLTRAYQGFFFKKGDRVTKPPATKGLHHF